MNTYAWKESGKNSNIEYNACKYLKIQLLLNHFIYLKMELSVIHEN